MAFAMRKTQCLDSCRFAGRPGAEPPPLWFGSRSGFTLIEMLTVILIIAILMGVSSAAIAGAHKSARRTRSRDLCRQLVVAWNAYLMDERKFPDESLFEKGEGDYFPASANNIGKRLNTTYNSKGEAYADSKVYFETSEKECERSGTAPNFTFSGTGVLDSWGGLILFALDFDYDGKILDQVENREVTCNAYSFAKCGLEGGRYRKKWVAAW